MNPDVHIKTEGSHAAGCEDNQGYTPNFNPHPVTFPVSQLGKYFVFTNLLQGSSIYTIPKLPTLKGHDGPPGAIPPGQSEPINMLSGGQPPPVSLNNAITIPNSVIGKFVLVVLTLSALTVPFFFRRAQYDWSAKSKRYAANATT